MRIVVYGPERRVGALQDDNVVDLNSAYAKLARESLKEGLPYVAAAANAPSDLEQFIILGDRAIEAAQRALDHVANSNGLGPQGERVVIPVSQTTLHAPLAHRGVICECGQHHRRLLQPLRIHTHEHVHVRVMDARVALGLVLDCVEAGSPSAMNGR